MYAKSAIVRLQIDVQPAHAGDCPTASLLGQPLMRIAFGVS